MFYKSFPVQNQERTTWQEIFLAPKDESIVEEKAALKNNELMKSCIEDAKKILDDKNFKLMQSSILNVALQLFSKRADHVVYYKEKKCREIFDRFNKKKEIKNN